MKSYSIQSFLTISLTSEKYRGSFVKGVDCPVKNKGVLIYTLNKIFPLFFTGRKLRPPGIGIEAPVNHRTYYACFSHNACFNLLSDCLGRQP